MINMKLISHRGNINGRVEERENQPDYIINALNLGYDVEIDFWLCDNKMMLGHDEPQYGVGRRFIIQPNLWIHAKNFEAFEFLVNNEFRCFWHTNEDVVLTSLKDIWIYPGNPLIKNSIAVLPETVNYSNEDLKQCSGICSDIIEKYKANFS